VTQRYIADPARGLIPAHQYYAEQHEIRTRARSGLACPRISTDTMEPVRNMLDGRMYDSKAALRATYKAHGVTEVGNDSSVMAPKPSAAPRPDRKQIRETVEKAFSRAGISA
jgi:hypothetical protein